jgi:FAD dependent oxidoreductase
MVRELHTEVLVVGGGLGGVAAALAAARLGRRVVLTEETDWLGGQLSAQAVPPDENAWIETVVASSGYDRLRRGIRDYYRRHYPLTPEAAAVVELNPGLGFVSRLCAEPRVAVAVIDEMLAPWIAAGRISVRTQHRIVGAHLDGDRVTAIDLVDVSSSGDDRRETIGADYVVDATELGDLLPLADVEHVIGAEGRDTTGELHAADRADPLDQQAISWCFAMEYRPGENHVIDEPAAYRHWLEAVAPFWPGSQLSWTDVEPMSLDRRTRPMLAGEPTQEYAGDLWHYRRIIAARQYRPGLIDTDVTLVNWPQIDYWDAPVLGVPEVAAAAAFDASRELSRSFLYWMQTAAPRHDGGNGYPELRLRPDVTGTTDGLAKSAYIRESRRIQAEFTILEQHVGVEARATAGLDAGSELFADTVGIGHYRIDLHPSTAGRTYIDVESYPFQVPLGSLIPVRIRNLLAANKNIGTTHITNGCYRLHPVEWTIGEAAGALAATCRNDGVEPTQVRNDPRRLADFQRLLTDRFGVTLTWPREIRRHRVRPEGIGR